MEPNRERDKDYNREICAAIGTGEEAMTSQEDRGSASNRETPFPIHIKYHSSKQKHTHTFKG